MFNINNIIRDAGNIIKTKVKVLKLDTLEEESIDWKANKVAGSYSIEYLTDSQFLDRLDLEIRLVSKENNSVDCRNIAMELNNLLNNKKLNNIRIIATTPLYKSVRDNGYYNIILNYNIKIYKY